MHLLSALLLSLLFLGCVPASISAETDYNPYMYSRTHSCVITSGTASTDYFSAEYISSFPNTVNVASGVFYSTQSLNVQLVDYSFVRNISNYNLEYYLEVDSLATTYLVTRIDGYLATPLYRLFDFRYLLVMGNTPWLGTYMTIRTLTLTTTSTSVSMPKPTSSFNTYVCAYIRDLKFEFVKNYFKTSGWNFYIDYTFTESVNTLYFHLSFPPVFTDTSNNKVRYTVIIMNSPGISSAYPGYQFMAKYYDIDTVASGFINIGYGMTLQPHSIFFGLNCIYMSFPKSSPSLTFRMTYLGNRINIGSSSLATYFYFGFFYTTFPYFVCKDSLYPTFNLNALTCSSINCAATRAYYNHTTKQCTSCRFDCLTCNSSMQCTSCDTVYRQMSVNFSCLPCVGYYQTNSYVPGGCMSLCLTCIDATNCTSCRPTYYLLANNTCLSCGTYFSPQCRVCNQTACLSCLAGYRLVNSSYCNLPCSDPNCLICNNANTAICFLCIANHQLSTSSVCSFIVTITPVCGNGKKETGEQCDDANLWAWDGCDPNCQQEPDYNCHAFITQVVNYTTHCAYTKSIQFSPISIQKLDYGNKITIIMSVKQYQHKFWTSRIALGYYLVVTPIPFKNMQVQLIQGNYYTGTIAKLAPLATAPYSPNSLFSVTFQYLQRIHGQTVNLCFNFSSSIDLVLSEIPAACQSLAIIPHNNKYANLYTDTLYQREKAIYNLCLLLAVASFGMFLVSLLIGGKRIAVELVVVIQITYVGLITVPKLTPIFSALTALSTANNGYNILYSNAMRPFEDTLADQRSKGVQMYSQFMYNLNTGLAFVIFPVLIGIIAVIISKARETSQQKGAKIKRFYQLALGEYTFVGLAFCGCIAGASAVLQIQYGMKDVATMGGMMSLVFCALLLLLYLLGAILRVKKGEWYDEYSNSLVKGNFSLGFQLICYFLWIIAGALLSFMNAFRYINACMMGIFMVLYFITLTRPIFNRPLDRYRTQLNLLTISFAQLPYLYANTHSVPQNAEDNSLSMMAPAAIVFLLLINFLANFTYFIYQAIKKLRAYLAVKQGKNPLQSQEKQKGPQQQRQQAKALIEMKKLQEGFISITENDQKQIPMTPAIKKSIQTLQRENSQDHKTLTRTNISKVALLQSHYIHANFENIAQL